MFVRIYDLINDFVFIFLANHGLSGIDSTSSSSSGMSPPTSRRCRQTKIESHIGRQNENQSDRLAQQNLTEMTQNNVTDSHILRQNIGDDDGLHSLAQIGRQNKKNIIQEPKSDTEQRGKQTRPHRRR